MIAKLKQFLTSQPQIISAEEKAKQLNLAAASLLLEVVMADESLSDEEARLLPALLSNSLSLTESDAQALILDAQHAQRNSTSLYEFTAEVNANFSIARKQELILAMWRLAYSDGHLCRYEDQIIRRTAELLHLKHSELIQMRNMAIESRQ